MLRGAMALERRVLREAAQVRETGRHLSGSSACNSSCTARANGGGRRCQQDAATEERSTSPAAAEHQLLTGAARKLIEKRLGQYLAQDMERHVKKLSTELVAKIQFLQNANQSTASGGRASKP